ncbi:MAG TPA: tRNA lysidine(34) synthetase TilS [Candidatus Glassbacteria bacterium]|nr:tRNA lysidine(34) synthetase TilS [Candidatus Glassbacteria bacterium]
MKRTDDRGIDYPLYVSSADRRFVRAMINSVRDYCKLNKITKPIVACSGGIDSTCLLHICLQVQTIMNQFQPMVAHVSHQLRPVENKKEIEFITHLFKNAYILDGKVEKGKGLQEKARDSRLFLLGKLLKETDANCVFTAHTETDDFETIIMRIFQKRISFNEHKQRVVYGIKPHSKINGMSIHRPLIFWSRKDVERYMSVFRLTWCEDSSNKSTDYARNFVRNVIVPKAKEKFK